MVSVRRAARRAPLFVRRAAAEYARSLRRGGAPLEFGGGLALLTGSLAVAATGAVPPAFYAAAVQVLPVLLVALVVEQRLADRIGSTENGFVDDAIAAKRDWHAWWSSSLPPEAFGRAESDWLERWSKHTWVSDFSIEAVDAEARRRYRLIASAQALTLLTTVVVLLAGETSAFIGVLSDGTGAGHLAFPVTAAAVAFSFGVIAVGAVGELLRALAWPRRLQDDESPWQPRGGF